MCSLTAGNEIGPNFWTPLLYAESIQSKEVPTRGRTRYARSTDVIWHASTTAALIEPIPVRNK